MTGYEMRMPWKNRQSPCWNQWLAVSIIIRILRARIEQHVNETKRQITVLEEILDRNEISRSVIKDSMSKMAALGQSIGGMFPSR